MARACGLELAAQRRRKAVAIRLAGEYGVDRRANDLQQQPADEPALLVIRRIVGGQPASRDASFAYHVCAENTLGEQACVDRWYSPPVAVAPTDVRISGGATGPIDRVNVHFMTVNNGQMLPDVRIYRSGLAGFRIQPLGRVVDFVDTQDVYAYTRYSYRVCTVSKVGVEACNGSNATRATARRFMLVGHRVRDVGSS